MSNLDIQDNNKTGLDKKWHQLCVGIIVMNNISLFIEMFPAGSVVKESACQCRRCRFDSWVGKIPWRRKWQPTPVFLPGKSRGQRAFWATVHGVTKSRTCLNDWVHTYFLKYPCTLIYIVENLTAELIWIGNVNRLKLQTNLSGKTFIVYWWELAIAKCFQFLCNISYFK